MAVVTFTTDFGTADAYAAAMKGVVLSLAPDAVLVDVSHAVPRHDVRAGAWALAQAAPYFPTGSIHVAVVDPGVGGERAGLVVEAQDRVFIGPDNGVLSVATQPPRNAFRIENPLFRREPCSATFHGRDVFAVAAGRVASGLPPCQAGQRSDAIVTLDVAHSGHLTDGTRGVVAHVDHFGNLITSFAESTVAGRWRLVCGTADVELNAGRAFSDVDEGALVLYAGSSGRMELAVRGGSAAERLAAHAGSVLQLWRCA
jgi:S-adenosylmethionine hydrolase